MQVIMDEGQEQRTEGLKGRRQSDVTSVTKKLLLRQTIITGTLFFLLGILYARIDW